MSSLFIVLEYLQLFENIDTKRVVRNRGTILAIYVTVQGFKVQPSRRLLFRPAVGLNPEFLNL